VSALEPEEEEAAALTGAGSSKRTNCQLTEQRD